MNRFKLICDYEAKGDQPEAIRQITGNIERGVPHQVLLGVTGSGKTFTMANVIERVNRPALIISHNKTLAAQLFTEFKTLFPENEVHFFVSYYDYYQPEAYIPSTDTFIEKDSSINEEIDRLRLLATNALFERDDVIIVASVSCIYGLGSPDAYYGMLLYLEEGQAIERQAILNKLIHCRYERNDIDFYRGKFRIRGTTIDIYPPYEEDRAFRVIHDEDRITSISTIDPLTGRTLERFRRCTIFPTTHYVMPRETLERAMSVHRAGTHRTSRRPEVSKQAPRSAAARNEDKIRSRDARRTWLLLGHRELFPSLYRKDTRGAPADPHGLSSRERPRHDRRKPRDGTATCRHVPR